MNIGFWDEGYNNFIEKIERGIKFYTKPKNEFKKSFNQQFINRRLETKRIRTHFKK